MFRVVMILAGMTAAMTLTGLTLASDKGKSAPASAPLPETFGIAEVIRHDLGTRRTLGYFVAENGTCRVTLVVAELAPTGSGPSAPTRITMTLRPGEQAEFAGEGITLACGPEARTMQLVRASSARS